MPDRRTYVIVGASLAGAKAAETLRSEGFDGRIVLVGAEAERPYERPPLSKDYLRGDTGDKPYVHDEGFYRANEIDLRTGTRVEALEPGTHEVVIAGGERLRYDRLLLTTGAAPRRLPIPGAELDGVHYLRELGDSNALGERIRGGAVRLVVIGAGWIGAEVAASAREKGCEVTVVERASVPLERVLGTEVGRVYRELHVDHGVRFLDGSGVERFEGDDAVQGVVTSTGETLEADLVVVGVGVAPRTELAEGAGLEVDNGIVVDERLRASAPDVFAAGDVANARHPFYGRRIRVEHWANALNQGPAAAKSMLDRLDAYEEIPYFFSDQYDTGMEYGGYATEWDEVIFRGDVAGREFIAFWLKDGRVEAGMNFNVWDVNEQIRELVRSRRPVDPAVLADPDIPLPEVATRARAGGGMRRFLADGVNYTRRFVRGRFEKGERISPAELERGEGKVLNVDGEKLAVYRDPEGELHAVSPVCTHLGCVVGFNREDATWDCPCHGSRFGTDGSVLNGPARKPLAAKALKVEAGEPRVSD